MPRKVLITGATGDTGRAAVKEAIALGLDARAMAHSKDARSQALEKRGVEAVFGDLLEIDTVRAAMEGADAAYFVWPVAPSNLWSGRREKLEESVDRLLELLDRAQDVLPDLHRSIHMAAGHLCDLASYIARMNPVWSTIVDGGKRAVEGTVNRLIGRRLGKGQHIC